MMNTPRHALHWAHLLHRVSGIALALFLPVHFYLLSLALTDPDAFSSVIAFTDQPLVKVAEGGLVFLLCAHLFGGLRLMALESLSWTATQKTLAAAGIAGSALVALLFFLQVARA